MIKRVVLVRKAMVMEGRTVARDGCALVAGVFDDAQCTAIVASLGPVAGAGRRGLLGEKWVADLAMCETLLAAVRPHLKTEPLAVRAIYFDKSAAANWLVPWHQDLTLALAGKADLAADQTTAHAAEQTADHSADHHGYGPWSVKAGVTHAQAPAAALEQMITIRLHLDDAGPDNGPLRVLPGSHQHGVLTPEQITKLKEAKDTCEVVCTACRGDVMLMRPLLLHASSKCTGPDTGSRHRRILHIEYAGFNLPRGLAWHETAVGPG